MHATKVRRLVRASGTRLSLRPAVGLLAASQQLGDGLLQRGDPRVGAGRTGDVAAARRSVAREL